MNLMTILGEQLVDPFRIALMIGLLITANNTAAQTGRIIPLVLGVVFVAVLIPSAFGATEHSLAASIGVGIVANAIIFAVCWLAMNAIQRLTNK